MGMISEELANARKIYRDNQIYYDENGKKYFIALDCTMCTTRLEMDIRNRYRAAEHHLLNRYGFKQLDENLVFIKDPVNGGFEWWRQYRIFGHILDNFSVYKKLFDEREPYNALWIHLLKYAPKDREHFLGSGCGAGEFYRIECNDRDFTTNPLEKYYFDIYNYSDYIEHGTDSEFMAALTDKYPEETTAIKNEIEETNKWYRENYGVANFDEFAKEYL